MQIVSGTDVNMPVIKQYLHEFDGENYSTPRKRTVLELADTLSQFGYPSNNILDKFHITFVGLVPMTFFLFIVDKFEVHGQQDNDFRYLVFVTGTIKQFQDFFMEYMTHPMHCQNILNVMYDDWCRHDLHRLYPEVTRTNKTNGLYLLESK